MVCIKIRGDIKETFREKDPKMNRNNIPSSLSDGIVVG